MKLHADRPQDRIDVEAMVATHRGSLDLNWIKAEWETLFELDDPRMQWFLETHRKVCGPR